MSGPFCQRCGLTVRNAMKHSRYCKERKSSSPPSDGSVPDDEYWPDYVEGTCPRTDALTRSLCNNAPRHQYLMMRAHARALELELRETPNAELSFQKGAKRNESYRARLGSHSDQRETREGFSENGAKQAGHIPPRDGGQRANAPLHLQGGAAAEPCKSESGCST